MKRLLLAAAIVAVAACIGVAVELGVAPFSTVTSAQETQVPLFEPDPLWAEALPNRWVTGQVGGVAVDSHDNVWVFHRPATIPEGERGASLKPPASECCIPAPSVLEFSPDGKLLQAWGASTSLGAGNGSPRYEWFTIEHGIYVDGNDNVWLSGSAKEDNQILKFTRDGKFLMQIGHAGQNTGSGDTENVGGPAGLFLYKKANELFVADGYFNHRVVVFDAGTGKFKRAWGAYGRKPDDSYKFPPRAQLIAGDPPPQFNNPVHAVLVSNDDLVYVADRTNNRLQIFNVDGTFVKEVFVARNTLQQEGTVHNFAFSPDREQRFLYVLDGSNKAIRVYNRQSMQMVENIGGHAGHNAREFFHAHSFASDSKGNLFIGEVNDGQRYYRYAFKGMAAASTK